ncbi:4638_t:CDS:2 [Diversispora eburnea]|uniref:4638_t:CDS:1 n=1 Tax=Diversispora eburnea TaxID=1213867 RepID=A0A9N8W3A2_9GLOM|nr:4638_t:CDS:2 [Diversispora eburnea]
MKIFVHPNLLTTTFIHRPNKITFTVWILNDLYDDPFAYPQKLSVQLWSNLIRKQWKDIELIEIRDHDDNKFIVGFENNRNYRVFELNLPTLDINEGWYEFCFRFRRVMEGYEEDWKWENIECWMIDKESKFINGQSDCHFIGNIKNLIRFFGLQRISVYWMAPITGTQRLDIQNKDVLYLIIQQSTGHYVILIPLTFNDCTSCFRSDDQGNLLFITKNFSGKDVSSKFIIGRGNNHKNNDPYKISKACMDFLVKEKVLEGKKKKLGEIKKQQKKKRRKSILLEFIEGGEESKTREIIKSLQEDLNRNNNLAYYDQIGYYFLNALESLDSSGIHVGYVILDDGWQKVNQSHKTLQSFEANEKFPNGLKSLIQNIKERYFYLKQFGVWHPIWGYWNGIDLNSNSFNLYQFEKIRQQGEGVNLIKVDHLASFDSIKSNEIEHIQWWKDYLKALRKGNKKYFKNRIIYSSRAISGGPIYISDPPNQHNVEILKRCVVKSIYSQRILRCDYPELPSLSILFDDVTKVNKLLKISNINNQRIGILGLWNCRNNEIVDKFGINDIYRIKINDDINHINNINGINHINHINNINKTDNIKNLNGMQNGNDDDDNKVGKYALYFFKNKKTYKIRKTNLQEQISIMVKPFDFEIVTILPMDILFINETGVTEMTTVAKVEIACFGLIDKYNGSKAIVDENSKKGIMFYKVDLIGYGECGFYLNVINEKGRKNEIYEIKEIKVYLGNEMLKDEMVNYDKENKLLIVSLCENENVTKDELLEYKRRKNLIAGCC